jgi:RNA ligase (TIGR02306 family)
VTAGDAEKDHPLFVAYTEIENMRNFPALFESGESVILSEKVHGTQCRVGWIEGELMAGSKQVRRKRPEEDRFAGNIYWFPLSLEPVRTLLETLGRDHRQVILFGEVYGSKIQSFHYGLHGRVGFRVFDLLLDGHYLDWPDFLEICAQHGVETVPVLATLPFDLNEIKRFSEGKTQLMQQDAHIREGVVVRPLRERRDPRLGRVILKYVSDTYLFGKKSDYTDV